MIRFSLILVAFLASIFWIKPELFKNLENKVVEFINPAAKEKTMLKGMYSQLDRLGEVNNDKTLTEEEKIKKINSIIDDSKNLVSDIQKINEKSDITATLSSAIHKFSPLNNTANPDPTWAPQCQP